MIKTIKIKNIKRFNDTFRRKHLIYDLDSTQFESYYEDGGNQLPNLSLFSSINKRIENIFDENNETKVPSFKCNDNFYKV